MHSICYYLKYIPSELQSEFLSDTFEIVKEKFVKKRCSTNEDGNEKIRYEYAYTTVVAKKN